MNGGTESGLKAIAAAIIVASCHMMQPPSKDFTAADTVFVVFIIGVYAAALFLFILNMRPRS